MYGDRPREGGSRGLERHAQSFILAISLGISGWVGLTTQSTSVNMATLSERVINLQSQILSLEQTARDQYTRSEAIREFAGFEEEIRAAEELIRDLDSRIRELENARGRP